MVATKRITTKKIAPKRIMPWKPMPEMADAFASYALIFAVYRKVTIKFKHRAACTESYPSRIHLYRKGIINSRWHLAS